MFSPYESEAQPVDAPISTDPIDLGPPAQPEQIDLSAPEPSKIPDEKVASQRAVKAHVAFAGESPGVEQLLAEIRSGNEQQARNRLAVAKDISLRQTKMDVIQSVAAEKARKGEKLTEDEVKFISGLSEQEIKHDPSTILETEYARQYFNIQSQLRGGDNVITHASQKEPDKTADEMDVASSIKTRQEIVKTQIEDLQREWDNTGWGSALASHAARFIPLLENIRLRDSKGDSILPGTNLQERVQRLWTMAPSQFKQQVEADIKELKALNPLTAMKYAHAVLSFSSSDELLDNAFGIMDASTVPVVGTAKLVAKGVRAGVKALGERSLRKTTESIVAQREVNEAKQALKDGVKADATVEIKPMEDLLEQSGDLEKSAQVAVFQEAARGFSAQDPLSAGRSLASKVPSLFNISRILEGSQSLAREAADRLRNTLTGNAADLISAFYNTDRITRLQEGSEALKVAIEKAHNQLKETYAHLNDAVLDMTYVRAEDTAANVNEAVMVLGKSQRAASEMAVGRSEQIETSLGKPDATLFKTRREAEFWATDIYKLRPEAYSVQTKQQGLGFHISVRGAVDETDGAVRDVLITTDHQTPLGLMNTFLGHLRTPEDTISVANRQNRHVATHGAQELHRLAKSTADSIGSIGRKSLKKLDEFLAAGRDQMYIERGEPRRGIFYRDVGEFDTAWNAHFRKAPTEQERTAYFSAVQLNDWDYVFRNLGLYRDKVRQGIEKYSFAHKVVDETSGESAMVKSNFVEGRLTKDIPWDDKANAGIWMYDGETNTGKFFDKNNSPGDIRELINNKIKSGYKVVQVANPIAKPFSGKIAETDEAIHFIVVPDVDRVPLEWKQLSYRPGGHVEYQYEHWTKQPIIRRTADGRQVYEGDQAVFNHATEAEAKKFAERMDTARVLLRDNKIDQLTEYLKSNLPYDLESFRGLFVKATLADGTQIEPRLSLSDPIRNTTSGRNIIDAHPDVKNGYDKFENQVRSPYNLYSNIDKKFASERDETLMTVRERMSGGKPLFALEPSKLINPLTTMNRAMANVMRGRFLNDYKTISVETFIQEFGDLIKVEGDAGLAELRGNPVFYLHNAAWDTQTPDKARLAAGMNAQRAILSLLGTQSELGRRLHWAQDQVVNFIYNKAGQGTSDYVAEYLLPTTKDPFTFIRSVAFHSKLGLFNPVQLFLQMQTLTHVMAVAGPSAGLRGLSAATMMRMLSLNPSKEILNKFAEMSGKFGWNKADFLESFAALKKTGLYNVEGEVALRDDIWDPKLFNGVAGKFLDKGTFFFREGERVTRLTAWNTAFHEWKIANPGKAVDNKAISEILLRQNTLSVNMTRASSAWWQQGILSVPTQFFAYQARLMEQFLGKRLTTAEKLRAFTTYAGMYGVPTATGAVTFAYPWYEDMRQSALERGVDLNAPGHKAIMEGIPSMLIGMMTDNHQNYAQRLGPGGIQYFKEIFEKGKIEQIFGASPKIALGMLKAVAPVGKALVSPFFPGMADWKMTSADIITALEEISTVNNVGKAIYAFNTHQFISKNEINLGPASTVDALMTMLIGTQPLAITDAFLIGDIVTEQKKLQDAAKKEIVKNWRRAMREFDQGNDTAADGYLNNMRNQIVGAGFRPDQIPALMSEAVNGHESLVEKMNEKLIKTAPTDQYHQRFNTLHKIKPDEESK